MAVVVVAVVVVVVAVAGSYLIRSEERIRCRPLWVAFRASGVYAARPWPRTGKGDLQFSQLKPKWQQMRELPHLPNSSLKHSYYWLSNQDVRV